MNSRKTIRYTMEDVAPAVAMLQKGGLVALPTETVYGLAVNAENSAAVWVLYEVKRREREKALSVLVTGMEMVENYCQNIPPQAYALAEHYWPGPLTMILEDKGVVSALVNDGSGTLGVRCPDHPLTQAILRQAGVALAAPSANPSDQPSPKTAQEVLDYFDGHIEGIVDGGPCRVGVESTIVDLTGPAPRSSGRGHPRSGTPGLFERTGVSHESHWNHRPHRCGKDHRAERPAKLRRADH
ncbi:MAG: L-threonylcarbamoyladenylate synthase [Evtepia gabavorous]